MGESPEKPDIDELKAALEWTRQEERHEISWIGNRLSWLLVSQAFLITAAITAQSNDSRWWYGFVASGVLGALGIWLSIRSMLAIRAAQGVIDKGWLAKACRIYNLAGDELNSYRINRGLHNCKSHSCTLHECKGAEDTIHREAVRLHRNIGWAFIAVWVAISILGFVRSYTQRFPDFHTKHITPYITSTNFGTFGIVVLIVMFSLFFYRYKRSSDNLEDAIKELTAPLTYSINQSKNGDG